MRIVNVEVVSCQGRWISSGENATKLSRTTKTNSEGLYRFEAVDPGAYSVKVNATDFGGGREHGH
jgi:protocatechuate 3,4-dioxygenase beta subunit